VPFDALAGAYPVQRLTELVERQRLGKQRARVDRGAVPPPDGRDLLELVRGVARVGGGTAHVFYAPMLVSDAATATAIRRQGDIAEAFALIPSVTIAVVSIGAWSPGLSTIYDAVTPAERGALTGLGVRAELAGCSSARTAARSRPRSTAG